jgi:hypothetical protein
MSEICLNKNFNWIVFDCILLKIHNSVTIQRGRLTWKLRHNLSVRVIWCIMSCLTTFTIDYRHIKLWILLLSCVHMWPVRKGQLAKLNCDRIGQEAKGTVMWLRCELMERRNGGLTGDGADWCKRQLGTGDVVLRNCEGKMESIGIAAAWT